MIKKNTKIIFETADGVIAEELTGGVPLSKGEVINVNRNGLNEKYEVIEKTVNFNINKDEQIANITYLLRKRK